MEPSAIIASIFQQYLGRTPTPAELTGFQSAMQSGVLDATGLALFIQGSSESQKAQIPGQTQQFADTLQKGNANILGQGFDQAQSMFAKQGRENSSGLSSAYAQVAGNLAAQQSPQIAQFQGGLQQNAMNPNIYGQNYLTGQQNWNSQQSSQAFQDQQAKQGNAWYQNALGQNFAQADKNNWFQLGGSLLGGAAKGAGYAAMTNSANPYAGAAYAATM